MRLVGISKYVQSACLAIQWSTEQPRQVILMILYAEEIGRTDKQNKERYFIEQKNISLKVPWKTMQESDRFWIMDSKAKRGRKENISIFVGN